MDHGFTNSTSSKGRKMRYTYRDTRYKANQPTTRRDYNKEAKCIKEQCSHPQHDNEAC